jgi:CHAT domain-containing protein
VRSEWKAAQISDAVTRLRCDLDRSRCAGTPAAEVRGVTRDDVPKPGKVHVGFDRQAAYELYQQIVAPVMPVLKGARNVYVVTSGALSSLPFSVLVTQAPKDGENDADPQVLRATPWLLREFALTTLPSVASLKALRTFEQQAAATAPAKFDFIGMGDPVLGAGSGPTGGRGPTRAANLFRSVASNGAGLADPQSLRESFNALPGTKVELEAMQQAFAPRAQILLGPAATETAVKTTGFEGVKVVAFSTHGLVAGEIDGIAEPGLVFTPPAKATAEDDGLLTATEVAQLKPSADWVLLSACNTASSDGTPGADALSGLARAFFYAGARSLLVSHWPVRDDVASRLTVDAIKREREHPELGRAEALRQATLAILDESASGARTLAQPSAWAPFSLVGEGM